MALGDTVNLLGNTLATNEADILRVINRQGVVAKTAGLAAHETAALSATLLAAGASPEIAATGMKNFLNALTRGESVTDRQSQVFEALGIDAVEMAKRMQTDATGGILSILDAFERIEPWRRNAMIGDLFGEEAKGAIAPLIDNADLLRETFARTADQAALMGGMEAEYRRQAETTRAARQRLLENLKAVGTVIGGQLLPMLNEMIETVMPLITQVSEWAAENPELIKQLGWIAAGLFGFKLASLALRFALVPLFSVMGGGLRVLGSLHLGLAALARLKPLRLAALVKPLRWTARLIPAIPWLALAGGKFLISTLLTPLRWSARLIPAISWLALTGGRFALASLVMALKWTARLIPLIGWTLLAGELLWHLLIKPLGWDKYLPAIDWARVWGAFSWEGWLPELRWAEFVSAIAWPDWIDRLDWTFLIPLIDWSYWFSFSWADLLPAWDWSAIIPSFNLGGALSLSERRRRDKPLLPGMDYRPPDVVQRQRRALGGPVRAGFAYEINEAGQELFVPAASGRVIAARDARALMAGGAGARGATLNVGDIHVHAAPGQSAEAIARAVMERLERLERRADGQLHDGGLYR